MAGHGASLGLPIVFPLFPKAYDENLFTSLPRTFGPDVLYPSEKGPHLIRKHFEIGTVEDLTDHRSPRPEDLFGKGESGFAQI
jgi:hypothetical protein